MRVLGSIFVVGAVLSVLGLAGCGNADTETGRLVGTLDKAAFLKRADLICARADKRQLQLRGIYLKQHPEGEQSLAGQIQVLEDVAFPPIRSELAELAEIGLPKEETTVAHSILRDYERALSQAEHDPRAVTKGDWPFAEAEKKAKAFGFEACALPS